MLSRRLFLRNTFLAGAGLVGGSLASGRRLLGAARPPYSPQVLDLVARTTVVDMLGLLTLDWEELRVWQREPVSFGYPEYYRLAASGVSVFHPAVDPNARDPEAAAVRYLGGWNSLLRHQAQFLVPVLAAADFERARCEGRVGVLLGLQSSEHFGAVADVARFHALGQRVSQLTYNGPSRLGSGCKAQSDRGLTGFGREIVAEMNRVGMAVDVSHCGERTTREAIALSRRPVLVTHANCAALAPHPRNKTDREIRDLAQRGGVMGLTTVRSFVRPRGPATLDDLLEHFLHVAALVGVEHVGIGSDCDLDPRDRATGRVRAAYRIAGLAHPWRIYDIAQGLLRRGFAEPDVELVLGGNFRRVLGEIWSAAA